MGGPPTLARLAVLSGGRFTRHTNDLGLGMARAQRDLACRYTLGFYVDGPSFNSRGIRVEVRRPGLRAIHPERFAVRTQGAKRQSLIRAAFFAPEMFESGIVRAHAFPMRPSTKRKWEALLVVGFPMEFDPTQDQLARDFGVVLTDGSDVVHRFDRRITLRRGSSGTSSSRQITFLEPIRLKPGRYELAVVSSDPEADGLDAVKAEIEVPTLPRDDLFLVGPVLGRRAGRNVVVQTGSSERDGRAKKTRERVMRRLDEQPWLEDEVGTNASFEPLLIQKVSEAEPLLALTRACVSGSAGKRLGTPIGRAILDRGGNVLGMLSPVRLEVEVEGAGKFRCQNLVDVVPAGSLEPGDYVFEVFVGSPKKKDRRIRRRIRFAVDPAESPASPGSG